MEYRIEKDTMGEVKVPSDKYWGAQTQRSKENFKIGNQQMPLEIIRAFAYLKKAAALTNNELGVLPEDKAKLIARVCDEILGGKLDDQLANWFRHAIEHERERGGGQPCPRTGRKQAGRGQTPDSPE